MNEPKPDSDRNGEFRIEQRYVYGWDDAGWSDDDVPVRFKTRAEAAAALVEYFEHMDGGDIADDEKYDRGEFRVVEVENGERGKEAIGDREKLKWKNFEILRDFIMLHSDDATEEGYVRLCSDAVKALDELENFAEDDDCACRRKDQQP